MGHGPRVVIDAETAQVGVADAREKPLLSSLGRFLQGRVELLDRGFVADLDDAKRLVDREPVAGRIVDRLVMRVDDLTDEERDWLRRSQRREQRVLEDFAGLHAEIRAEGVALIDPEQELTDMQFPGTGTVAWAALLLIGQLVGELTAELTPASGTASVPIPDGRVEELLGALTEEHRAAWSQELTASPDLLTDAVLDLLHRMRLIMPAGPPQAGWLLTAAAARYAPEVSR